MSEQKEVVITLEGKLCFDRHLFEKDDKEKFGASMVIPNNFDTEALKRIMMVEANKRWPNGLPNGMHWGVKPEDASKLAQYPYLAGCNLISAKSGFDVPVGNTAGQEVGRDGIKGGDTVRFSVTAYAYDANGNKGVGLNLGGILLVKECAKEEAFFQKADVNSMFGSVMTSYDNQAVDNFASSQQPQEAPAQDMSSMNF